MCDSIYISECGKYIAFSLGHADFDVIQDNGNYWPDPPLCDYPLRRQVGGFSNLTGSQHPKNKFCFSLDLLECDTTMKIKPLMGNTVIKDKEVRFYKKISHKRLPKWAKAMAELLKITRGLSFEKPEALGEKEGG